MRLPRVLRVASILGLATFATLGLLSPPSGVVTAQSSYPNPFDREGATRLLENDRVIVWDNVWKKGRRATRSTSIVTR